MPTRRSPIFDAGLRDSKPSWDVPARRLLIYTLRAYDYHHHPYFMSRVAISDSVPRDLIFDSLAFRLRPLAMTDSDDCSIWSTLQTLREMQVVEPSTIDAYESRYRAWLAITEEELRPWWPTWKVDEPMARQQHADFLGYGTPIEELWDRVFGDGPHSDYKRVLRNKVQDLTPGGPESRHARYGKLIATIYAIYPLVADLQNEVSPFITKEATHGLPGFSIGR